MKIKKLKKLITKILLLNIFFINFLIFEPIFSKENYSIPTVDYLRKNDSSNNYILGPFDVISIKVSDDLPEMDMNIQIDGEGFAFLKRLERVYISGLTVNELKNILNEEYKKYILDPNIEIVIREYRPVKVFLKGEVKSPGSYILSGSGYSEQSGEEQASEENQSSDNLGNIFFPTIIDALREAGGLKTKADLSNIKIIRNNTRSNGGGKKQTTLSLVDKLGIDLNFNNNIRLFDGDQIIISKSKNPILDQLSLAIRSNINPKFLNIYVGGRLENPGTIKVASGSTLNTAILLGGGKKFISGKVTFIRYQSDGKLDRRVIRYNKSAMQGSYNNPFLEDQDIIFIGKSKFNVTAEVLDEITSPFSSVINAYGLFKILND